MANNGIKFPELPDLGDLFPDKPGTLNDGPTYEEKLLKKYTRGKPELKLAVVKEFTDQTLADEALEVINNFGGEAKDIIMGIPILGAQVARGAINAAANPTDSLEAITSGRAWDSLKEVVNDFASSVGQDYKDRWGPLFEGDFEEFARRTKGKPLSFLLDVGGAMSLAGGALKAGGKAISKTAASTALKETGTVLPQVGGLIRPLSTAANPLEAIGIGLENAGRVLDPLQLGIAGVKKVGKTFPTAPIIGENAQFNRMKVRLGIDLSAEETARARFGYIKHVDGKAIKVKGLDQVLDEWKAVTDQLQPEEVLKLPWHLNGMDTIPLSQQSEAFRKSAEIATEIWNNPENLKLMGIASETARRRVAFPLLQKYALEGKLPIDDQLFAQLNSIGAAVKIDGKIHLRAPGGIENLPSQVFDDNFLLPIQEARDKAIYVPLLNAEAELSPHTFVGRITAGLDTPKSPFKESFAGDMSLKYLTTKDPSIIHDIRATAREFAVEKANAEILQNVTERLVKATDPATGERLAKLLYLGETPTHVAKFQSENVLDLAGLLNKMDKPFRANSIDDLYKAVHGKTKDEWISMLRHDNPGMSIPAAAKYGDDAIAQELSKRGFDGYFAKDGHFKIFDETKHPFPKLLDDHVAFAPKQLLKQQEVQRGIAQRVAEMGDGVTLKETLDTAGPSVFPQKDELYKLHTKDLEYRAKNQMEMFNDEFMDGGKLAEFNEKLRKGLKKELQDLSLDRDAIVKLVSKNDTAEAKLFRAKGGGSINSANWVMQIPKGVADGIMATLRPNTSVNTAVKVLWDSPLQLWRTLVLNYSGRWHVNNFFGNAMLNVLSGTLNPIDYVRAGKILGVRLAERFPRAIGTPTEAVMKLMGVTKEQFNTARGWANMMPPELYGTFAKAENYPLHLPEAAVGNMAKLQASILNNRVSRAFVKGATASADLNSLVDQFFRDAQFFKIARGQIRKESTGAIKKLVKSFYVSDDAMFDFAARMNSETATKMVKEIGEWLPDYTRLLNETEKRVVRRIVPFYSWYKHMIKTSFMIPLKHPKRAALIGLIGKIGSDLNDQDLREAGLDPNDVRQVARWLKGTIRWGEGERGPKFLSVRALNPLNTVAELSGSLGSALDPRIQTAIEHVIGYDLFTKRPLPTKVVIGDDGVPREVSGQSLMDDLIGLTPQTEFIRRLIKPDVENSNGEVLYRRDRIDEFMKLMGVNRNEQDVQYLTEKAEKKRGEAASKAFNQMLNSGDKNKADRVNEVLNFIRNSGQ